MAPPSHMDRSRKEEYFEILDETIRTNPYRKSATAMASVMSKHGISSDASNVLGKPALGVPKKECALTKSLRLAQYCNQKLSITKDELQSLCCEVGVAQPTENLTLEEKSSSEEITANIPEPAVTENHTTDRAVMTGHLLTLIGEAQTIAKRIYETAVGLHVAEDYLRQPDDLKLLDFSSNGRIQIPNYNFNHASQLCLEWLHSTATKWLRGFKEDGGDDDAQFIKVFENFTKAVKDYTEAVCLANQVFRVLLYPNLYGKETLQEYVLSLGHVLKNDIMMEVQSLRRAFDSIQYSFERLGWAASIAWMMYSGKRITVETLNENGIQVDHSLFQHKFYEGPTKSKKKTRTDKVGGIRMVPSSSTTSIKKNNAKPPIPGKRLMPKNSKNEQVRNDTENGSVIGWSAKSFLHNNNSALTLPISRSSQSTPNVAKSRKIPKKKETTGNKQIRHIFSNAITDAPSAGALTVDVSAQGSKLGLLKLLKNEKAYYMSGSTSTINSSNNLKSKTNDLTPPPIIPPAWRKQFGAVFGPHLVPQKPKGTKKPKKKLSTAAAGNATLIESGTTASSIKLKTEPENKGPVKGQSKIFAKKL